MRILALSDRVEPILSREYMPERFAGIDLVLSCGDLPPEYLSFVANALRAPCFYVRGNHDIRYDSKPPGGCTDLHARLRWVGTGPFTCLLMNVEAKREFRIRREDHEPFGIYPTGGNLRRPQLQAP